MSPYRTIRFTVPGQPVGKPTMTRRDKWQLRPAVGRYRDWCDEARLSATGNPRQKLPDGAFAIRARLWVEMPASWSKKKRAALAGKMCQAKPDWDNAGGKALCDALFDRDETIAHACVTKRWCREGEPPRVEVVVYYPPAADRPA